MAATLLSAPVRRATATHRPDIDAMRALAIVLVVAYHADVSAVAGGFVGVDVFFAISGFLITRNLLVERAGAGRIDIVGFWMRRLRRLVPAMALMVVATVAVGTVVLVPLQWEELATQGLTASLYVSNLHFAGLEGDYFAAGVGSSPLLHTWSLAVEEQFYLAWPLLLAGVLALGARARRTTPVLVATLSIVAIASFAWSVVLVERGSTMAFYGLPSRAWEFALAGLLAVVTWRWERSLRRPVALLLAALGLLAIGVPVATYTEATAFPGVAALAPVAGTLALLLAGSWSQATWGTAIAPVRWLGRTSYSWYLWHWPAMVLAVAATGIDTPTVRLTAGLLALCIAQLSLTLVEDPVRRAPRLARSRLATLSVSCAFTLLAVTASLGLQRHHDDVLETTFHGQIASASDKRYLDDCTWSGADAEKVCTLGDPSGDRTIVLTGDSHAMSWAPAFHLAGQELGARVLVRTGNSCPAVPVPTMSAHTGELNTSCMDYRTATRQLIDERQPDLVVLVSADFTRRVADEDGVRIADRQTQLDTWALALATLRDELAAQGIAVGAILDNPRVPGDPLVCVEREGDVEPCTPDRRTALRKVRLHIANEAAVLGPEATMDTVGLSCSDERCEIWDGERYVYADGNHLSADFTEAHVDDVLAFVQRFGPFAPPRLAQPPAVDNTGGP